MDFASVCFTSLKQWCGENLDPNSTEFIEISPWSAMKLVFLNVSNGDLYGLYGLYIYIAGWWLSPTPLKNDGAKVSWDDFSIPNWMKNTCLKPPTRNHCFPNERWPNFNRMDDTLWLCQNSYGKWPSRNSGFTDLPIENGGSFHRFLYVYQRVTWGLSSDLEFQLSNLWTVDPSHRFRPLRDPHRSRTWENFSHGMVAWLRRRGP